MRALITGLVVMMILTAMAFGKDTRAEDALSRLLLDRPFASRAFVPGGFAGAYTNPRTVAVLQLKPCVFRLVEEGLDENGDHGTEWKIDFNKVTAIHVDLVDRPKLDPAVARLYRIEPATSEAVLVTFFTDTPANDEAFCHVKICGGDRIGFLQPAEHLPHARQAAIDFQTYCPAHSKRAPGSGLIPPPSSSP